jgi:DnaJ-class molecular chaperone
VRANPKTAARWPEGTRVVTSAEWRGTIIRVLAATSGSGAVRVKWDNPRFGCESSVISNPDLNLRKLDACPRCHGDGEIAINPGWPDPQCETSARCPDCGGTGEVDE